MRNILQIFLRDVKKISHNTIALIIMIGILVVPTLYAWFNIGGSWDPYEKDVYKRQGYSVSDCHSVFLSS